MILESMPDNKIIRPNLTLGKDYKILGVFGNGYRIEVDDGSEVAIILQSRFKLPEQ